MRTKLFALALACAMALGGAAHAQKGPGAPLSETPDMIAADFGQRLLNTESSAAGFRPSGNPLQVTAARNMLAEAGVTCDIKDAGAVQDVKKNGVRSLSYEAACKNDFGWIVTRTGDTLTAYDCQAILASSRGAPKGLGKGIMTTCRLRANVGSLDGLQSLTAKVGAKCTVANGVYLGGGGTPPISRYEVACKEGGGYVIDSPQPKSTARLLAAACSADPNGKLPCTLEKDKKPGTAMAASGAASGTGSTQQRP
jgi:hypothetical protein